MNYRLTAKAEDDFISIYLEGSIRFGDRQADKYSRQLERVFELIAANPELAREREEIVPPVRIHPYGSHVIVYRVESDGGILIVRIRHGRENWDRDPM